VDVVALRGLVDRTVALVAITQAVAARSLSTAVVVRNDVVLRVDGVAARADPRDRRRLGARRTHVRRTATATAQKSIERAVAPGPGRERIALLLRWRRARRRRFSRIRAGDWQ